jgi:hypothetical protein
VGRADGSTLRGGGGPGRHRAGRRRPRVVERRSEAVARWVEVGRHEVSAARGRAMSGGGPGWCSWVEAGRHEESAG